MATKVLKHDRSSSIKSDSVRENLTDESPESSMKKSHSNQFPESAIEEAILVSTFTEKGVVDKEWIQLAEKLKKSLDFVMIIGKWIQELPSLLVQIDEGVSLLRQKGQHVQKIANLIPEKSEKLKNSMTIIQEDHLTIRLESFLSNCKELNNTISSSKELQSNLMKHKKYSERLCSNIYKFLRASRICAQHTDVQGINHDLQNVFSKKRRGASLSEIEPLILEFQASKNILNPQTAKELDEAERNANLKHLRRRGSSVDIDSTLYSPRTPTKEIEETNEAINRRGSKRLQKEDKKKFRERATTETENEKTVKIDPEAFIKYRPRSQSDASFLGLSPASSPTHDIVSSQTTYKRKKKSKKVDNESTPDSKTKMDKNKTDKLNKLEKLDRLARLEKTKVDKKSKLKEKFESLEDNHRPAPLRKSKSMSEKVKGSKNDLKKDTAEIHMFEPSLLGGYHAKFGEIYSSQESLERLEPLAKSSSNENLVNAPFGGVKITRSVSADIFYLNQKRFREKRGEKVIETEKKIKELPEKKNEELKIEKFERGRVPSVNERLTTNPLLFSHSNVDNMTISALWNNGNFHDILSSKNDPSRRTSMFTNHEFSKCGPKELTLHRLLANSVELRRNESINFHPKGFEELGKSSNSNPSYVRIVEHEKEVLVIEHKDGNTRIIAGLLDQLIEKIVDLSTEDVQNVKALILTYKQFCSPTYLLEKLISIFNVPLPIDIPESDLEKYQNHQESFQKKVLNCVYLWVNEQWLDFHFDPQLLDQLEEFIDEAKGDKFEEIVGKIVQTKSHQMSKLEFQIKKELKDREIKIVPPIVIPIDSPEFYELDAKLIANQLTLVNLSLYSSITPTNFYKYMMQTTYRRLSLANFQIAPEDSPQVPIETFIERSELITRWIACEILGVSKTKTRRIILRKVIRLAKFCSESNDFFATFAIMSAIYLPCVKRLKKTWEGFSGIEQKMLQSLSYLMDPTLNMENYRKTLEQATSPIIPFFPILSRELIYCQEKKEPNTIENLIHFGKYFKIYETISKFVQYGKETFPFERVDKVSLYIEESIKNAPTEETLDKVSRELSESVN